jgi:hypothetical protein
LLIKPPHKEKGEDQPTGQAMPSVMNQIKSAAAALGHHISTGMVKLSDEDYNKRMSICGGCERFTDSKRCLECGCYMETKARWQEQQCKLNKW